MPFRQLKKLSEIFIKKIDAIEVEPNKCCRVRSVVSQCTACQEVCPTEAVSITRDSVQLTDTCINCGLCTAVCPTNALKWNHPPLLQLYNQWANVRSQSLTVTCRPMLERYPDTDFKAVPCLGMIPAEFWFGLGRVLKKITLICDKDICADCAVKTGYACLMQQLAAAQMAEAVLDIVPKPNLSVTDEPIDHGRRRMLHAFLAEAKETHAITVKEMLSVNQTRSPFEKFDRYVSRSQAEEMAEAVHEMKRSVVDRLLEDALVHTDKRAILLAQLEREPALADRLEIDLPHVGEGCTLCGACAFLCPAEALYNDEDSLLLSPGKCVSCNLCAEICWEKHITLLPRKSAVLQEKYVFLYKK